MKKIIYFTISLLFSNSIFSQINSPNGDNIFFYDGAADVIFKYPPRGTGGRAFVHYPNNILNINYNEDFTGGTLIGKNVFFKDNGNSYVSSGNFGVGTSTPNARLYVNGGDMVINNSGVGILRGDNSNHGSGGALKVSSSNNAAEQYVQLGRAYSGTGEFFPHLTIMANNGNIGIGTTNPTQKLEVSGSALFQGMISSSISDDGGGKIQLVNPSKTANGIASTWAIYNMTGVYGNSLQFWAYDNLSCGTGLCNNRFTIMDNGNVGIGTTIPGNKLDVNGTIHSREVKVDMNGWPDFVFKKEYNLPTLDQVEKHIADKGHLENIPSEEEVMKDGISLGEMNAKLLQKIEELTLYVIEQNKKIDVLEKQNDKLTALEKRLAKIESNSK